MLSSLIIALFVIPFALFLIRLWIKGLGKCTIKHDMSGKFVIITGSNSGLGQHSAYDLLLHGARVVYACRNKDNALKAINEVPEEFRKNASFIPLDLTSFKSIKAFVEVIKADYPPIDILMNNAGAMPLSFSITEDSLESYVQGNHLGPVLLTFLLLNNFTPREARIINVSSAGHYFGELTEKSIDVLSNPERINEFYFKRNKTFELYSATKLMNIYFTQYLADNLRIQYPHIKAVCLHPGGVNTNFARANPDDKIRVMMIKLVKPLLQTFAKTSEEGAQTQLYLSYLPHNKLCSGAYYADCNINRISQRAQNSIIRDSIMNWSLRVLEENIGSSNLPSFSKTLY